MSRSLYDVSVPTLSRVLKGLSGVLEKGRTHAESEKIDPAALLSMRLYPDMLPLVKQVQIVSDNAKGCVARLTQNEPPKFADTESNFPELQQRIGKTFDYLQGFSTHQFEGADERPVVLNFPRGGSLSFASGWEYLLTFALPNVYFHYTTAYDLLRHGGVRIGKADFLGGGG